jgi:hypothetical protein
VGKAKMDEERAMRPRRKNESLTEYAEAASRELHERTVAAYNARGLSAVWDQIFTAICHEGQYVREASPAAVVIYQKYVTIAVHYLKEHPDDEKTEELSRRVTEDLTRNHNKFLLMKNPSALIRAALPGLKPHEYSCFDHKDVVVAAQAFGIISKTIGSLA